MGFSWEEHRPLMAGVRIYRGGTTVGTDFPGNSTGTLTGVATRHSDRRLVLVTNLRVMADDKFEPVKRAGDQAVAEG